MGLPLPPWAYAAGPPPVAGLLRHRPEDFVVDEVLGFEPDGEGEHVLVRLQKRGANTDWAARQLARLAGVRPAAVGYAGLKDRHAVTSQWFSVQLAGRGEPDWSALAGEGLEVLAAARHRRKLRRGALAGNRFELVLRQLSGETGELEGRLQTVVERGVPNYFGAQRFGRGGGNLERAEALFAGRLHERNRTRRGLYLSAARSFLFNQVLSRRVAEGSWDRALTGEVLVLAGSRSFFLAETPDAETERRLAEGDIDPSGPLWGRGELPSRGAARELEEAVVEPFPLFREGLEAAGMDQERRPLRLRPEGLEGGLEDGGRSLRLRFTLPAGAYATTVLRELVATDEAEAAD